MGGAYPTYLAKLLGDDYLVKNGGVSGTTVLKEGDKPYWTQGKLSDVFAFKPDLVTIKLGTNDTKSQNWNTFGSHFKRDYTALIDTLMTLATPPAVFPVLPVPAFSSTYGIRNSIIDSIIPIINQIALERHLTVIDANLALKPYSSYFSDGIHPDEAGSEIIAQTIYQTLSTVTGTRTGTIFRSLVPSNSKATVQNSLSPAHPAQFSRHFLLTGQQVRTHISTQSSANFYIATPTVLNP